jgi:hypothetical protein
MRNWLAALILAVVAVAAGLAVKAYSDYTLDDSFIGYRYAENIAAGKGFVYNEGERELGTTTPLYILVLALFGALGLPVPSVSLVLGLMAFSGTVVLTRSIARRLGAGDVLAFLVALGLAGYPPALKTAISGMETSVYAFLVLLVIDLYLTERMRWFPVAGAVLFLVRPDGAFLLATVGLFDLFLRGGRVRDWVRQAAIVVALCLPWLVFSKLYFGIALPNSGFAKLLQMSDWGHFSRLIVATAANVAPILLLVGLGFVSGIVRDRRALLPGLYVLVHFAAFSALGFPACPWYLGPVHAPLLITAALGAALLLRSLPEARTAVWVLLALLALYQYSSAPGQVRRLKYVQTWTESHHGNIGRWLGRHAPPGTSVACDNIGYIGYYSGRRIIDVTGLIQNEVLDGIRRTNDRAYAIRAHRPEYIAVQTRSSGPKYLPPDEWFVENGYRLVHEEPYSPKHSYNIWTRLPPGPATGGR